MPSPSEQTILITGGSGYIASHVLSTFLSKGYQVRTTVRSLSTAEKVKKTHPKYLSQLSFSIVPDLLTPNGYDEAVKGVDGIIHTASPFLLSVSSNEKDLLLPAINGTLSLLKSVTRYAPQVKKVILTSSFASILNLSLGLRPDHTYTEKDWNPDTFASAADPKTNGAVAYCASKSLAEKAAFEYVEKHRAGFEVLSICPPMVYGPAIEGSLDLKNLNTSSADIYRLMNNSTKEVPDTDFFAWADVRDVAMAHLLAFEDEREMKGREREEKRFLVVGGRLTYQDVCDFISREFKELEGRVPVGKKGDGKRVLKGVYGVDGGKVKRELFKGSEMKGFSECFGDMVREFLRLEKEVEV